MKVQILDLCPNCESISMEPVAIELERLPLDFDGNFINGGAESRGIYLFWM